MLNHENEQNKAKLPSLCDRDTDLLPCLILTQAGDAVWMGYGPGREARDGSQDAGEARGQTEPLVGLMAGLSQHGHAAPIHSTHPMQAQKGPVGHS